jgi:hypothetical protein
MAVFFVFCVSILIGMALNVKNRHRRIQSAFEEEYGESSEACHPEVKDMVALYMSMVAKHGPDSEEAKAFRFGTDSQLMTRLHGEDSSLKAFHEQADVIDEVCRRVTKWRRGSRKNSHA